MIPTPPTAENGKLIIFIDSMFTIIIDKFSGYWKIMKYVSFSFFLLILKGASGFKI